VVVDAGRGAVAVHVHRADRDDPPDPAAPGQVTELARFPDRGAAGERVHEHFRLPALDGAFGREQCVPLTVQVLNVCRVGGFVVA
jgi:hypothetical protein